MTAISTECSCQKCVSLCRRNPGWMTPAEARAAIAAGLAERLMLDYWTGIDNVYVLAPAAEDCEGGRAPNTEELFGGMDSIAALFHAPETGKCTFFEHNRCSIHASGFKPVECRESMGCSDKIKRREDIKEDWKSDEAKALVREWMALVGMDEKVLEECS